MNYIHSSNPLQEDSTRDDEEAKSDFWTITGEFIDRHHVDPRRNISYSHEVHRRCQNTKTSLDVVLEKID